MPSSCCCLSLNTGSKSVGVTQWILTTIGIVWIVWTLKQQTEWNVSWEPGALAVISCGPSALVWLATLQWPDSKNAKVAFAATYLISHMVIDSLALLGPIKYYFARYQQLKNADMLQEVNKYMIANSVFWSVLLLFNLYVGCCLCSYSREQRAEQPRRNTLPAQIGTVEQRERLIQRNTVAKQSEMSSVPQKKIRITCIGDSITEGNEYVSFMQKTLGDKYEVTAFANSGRTLMKKGVENDGRPWSYWDTSLWRNAQKSNPDIVTILLGTNDSKIVNGMPENQPVFEQDYLEMVRTMKNLPSKPKVYVCVPPRLFEPWPFNMNGKIINELYPKLIPKLAKEAGVFCIDLQTPFIGHPELTEDKCHPNMQGYELLAKTMLQGLNLSKAPLSPQKYARVPSKKLRITCIGDSITEGNEYVSLMQKTLGDKYEVTAFANSGRTLMKKGVENDGRPWSYWDTSLWRNAQRSNPDIVTILLGTNDSKIVNGMPENQPVFEQDYLEMIRTMKNLPSKPKVYVCVPPRLFEPWPFNMNGKIINELYPRLIPKLAKEAGVFCIDLQTPFIGHPEWTEDKCHPNMEGYQIVASTIIKSIGNAL